MSDHYKPSRYYKKFGIFEEVSDGVCGSDGNTHIAIMKGWYWNQLDWISRNTATSEAILVDMTVMGHGKYSFSQGLQVAIWSYINAYTKGSAKNRSRKVQGGHA